MKMKYFQTLADIRNRYNDILRYFDEEWKYGYMILNTWGINPEDKDDIFEEREVLRYLLACQHELARGTNAKKPSLEVVQRCFNRYLAYLERAHDCNAHNVNKHPLVLIQKEYKACRHYLFKFSLPAWYKKLPDEILTFDNKYPDFDKRLG